MPEKKNKNTIGIVIGAIAAVAIVGVSAFAINKWDKPIMLVGSTNQETTSSTEANVTEGFYESDIEVEEDIWGEDLGFEEEGEEIILDSEIVFEEEDFAIEDYQNDYENSYIPTPTVTYNPTTKPTTPTNSTTVTTTKKDNDKDSGLFGYELDPTKSHFFTSKDAWQRNFGFCKIYDDAAPLIAFYYDTERILFQYGEYDWMVQLWKGQYGFIFIGSEIGVYHKEIGRDIDFYDCAEDENCLKMKMALYRDEDTLLFDRPEGYYWWTTGFVPGKLDRFADRSELKVVAKITLFDSAMTKAFLEGFEEAGFVEESKWVEPDVQPGKSYIRKKFYTVSGNTVSFTWQ